MKGSAEKLARKVGQAIMARETLIDALPPKSLLTVTINTDAAGLPDEIRVKIESTMRATNNGIDSR